MSEYPSLSEQGKNLAQFVFDTAKKTLNAESIFVSDEIRAERLDICNQCEHYDSTQQRCKQCGCFLEQKTKFSSASCPIDKWKKINDNNATKMIEEFNQMQQSDENHPVFPPQPNVDQIYQWRDWSWKWDGSQWNTISH
jgi:hypothetical protein